MLFGPGEVLHSLSIRNGNLIVKEMAIVYLYWWLSSCLSNSAH